MRPARPVSRARSGSSPMRGDGVVELEGTAAMAAMAELLGEPEASVWVDLIAPTPSPGRRRSATALGLHPLIVEDVLEGNQRAKIETTDGVVHIVLFHLSYGDARRGVGARHRPRRRASC